MVIRLSERWPEVSSDRLLSECVPPPRFADVRFATYRPDPDEPSQAEALAVLVERASMLAGPREAPSWWSRLRGRGVPPGKPGIYLDGRFWLTEPLGKLNAPTGWGNPIDEGVVTLEASDAASYLSQGGDQVAFAPAPKSFEPPLCQ